MDGRLITADQLAELSATAFVGTDQVFGNPARLALGYPFGRVGAPADEAPTAFGPDVVQRPHHVGFSRPRVVKIGPAADGLTWPPIRDALLGGGVNWNRSVPLPSQVLPPQERPRRGRWQTSQPGGGGTTA
ncbi:hypothetical protein GCM10010306_088700 [Streptomyces umbrinus]|nr:hypothetical protein GCM10010306_088700 [Streptomyces umbrinus]